jgi:L-histidine N-alpha-methyltransferase
MKPARDAASRSELARSTESAERPSGQRPKDPLLRIDEYGAESLQPQLARDVEHGLTGLPKTLPSKYFYDDRGSHLFDRICDLPEYYPTRTEQALLERIAHEVIGLARPSHLIELGSGASRKTRVLLDALTRVRPAAWYVPIDVSGGVLRRSAAALRGAYPRLRVHGVVGDYERHLRHIPPAERRLAVFLGSTIGNFTRAGAVDFLAHLARHLSPGDSLLLGVDLVKPVEILNAAYNDSSGLTAEFNLNVLRVINRELRADFDLARFAHLAFFDREASQIEMHLRARWTHDVDIAGIGRIVHFEAGETIRTEISRKFTRASTTAMLEAAGFAVTRWYASADDYFGLVLAAVASPGARP